MCVDWTGKARLLKALETELTRREPAGQTLGVLGDAYDSAAFRDLVTAIAVPLGERQFPRSDSPVVGVDVSLGLAQRSIS